MNLPEEFSTLFHSQELILAVLSSPRKKESASKATLRPLLIKGEIYYQLTEQRQQQAFHRNLSMQEALDWLQTHVKEFKQTILYTVKHDYHLLVGKKENLTVLKKAPSKTLSAFRHNRKKEYQWQEGTPIPFLVHLGVMKADGSVQAAKRDKFRQINRFLEMIEDLLPHFSPDQPLKIIDFGCGKAYLTFALYHFLKMTKGYSVHMVGLDLKKEVIESCRNLAHKLGYQADLEFRCGDINDFEYQGNVDLVVALHACDTATDAALEKAVRWQSKAILAVPCCQHELFSQIQQEALKPLLKHGILKERFSALATDAARAQLLEVLGYQTQILEFIEVEHTPKNLLIRAVKRSQPYQKEAAWQAYVEYKNSLHITPSLEKRFHFDFEFADDDQSIN